MRSLVSFNFFVGESQRSDRIGVQLPGVQNVYLFDESWYAGGGPAATFFLCFAKERRQRKATAQPLPFGFPIVQIKKWEANETRYAQTAFTSFSIFCPEQSAASQRLKFNGSSTTALSRAESKFKM